MYNKVFLHNHGENMGLLSMGCVGSKMLKVQKLIREIIGRKSTGLLKRKMLFLEREIPVSQVMGVWDTIIEKIQYMPILY